MTELDGEVLLYNPTDQNCYNGTDGTKVAVPLVVETYSQSFSHFNTPRDMAHLTIISGPPGRDLMTDEGAW